MKKLIYVFLSAVLAFGALSGCSTKKEEENKVSADDAQSRAVGLDDIGLYYVTPAVWAQYQGTNIIPQTVTSDGALARVIYGYISSEDAEIFAEGNEEQALEEDINDYITPICEITVAETDNFENGKLSYIDEAYENKQELDTQGDYSYYIYSVSTDKSLLSEEDLAVYETISSEETIQELTDSLFTKEFNPDDVKTVAESLGLSDYITFETKTLEGEDISSTCFGDYDVTLLNFWGTYAIENSNEQAVLQEVYEKAQSLDKKVNVINAVVDTPDEEAEKLVKELKEEAGGKFTTIVMDETLANWATENLEGVPTTILVDSDGKIVSDQVKGAKGTDYYMELIETYLNEQ